MATESKGEDTGPVKITIDKVTRLVSFTSEAKGEHELIIEGLPAVVDVDSVRVNGTGHVTLQEVSFEVHHKPYVEVRAAADGESETSPEVIHTEIASLDHDIAELTAQLAEVRRSQKLLNTYTSAMLERGAATGKDGEALSGERLTQSMEFAFTLMERSQERNQQYNDRITELNDAVAAKNKLKGVANSRLRALGRHAQDRTKTKISRDVTVVLDVQKPGAVNLKLIYMVSNASWAPAYDARMNSDDSNVSLTYFGMVRQTTGENWTGTKLVLSTATPSVGGSAPILPTKHVGYYNPRPVMQYSLERAAVAAAPRRMMRNRQAHAFEADFSGSECESDDGGESYHAPAAAVATSKVDSSGAATTFHIERRTTIGSDNKPHKVTVAILSLSAAFRHYTVPALNAVAYLQCLTTNNTDYTLLASESVNVFLDNSFISKTKLPNVAPGENFRTFLGVDKAVKVEYRPVSCVHQEKGYFSKSEAKAYKFVTTIKNARSRRLQIVIADMLPRADDTNIKVKLVSPSQEEVDAGTKAEAARKAGSRSRRESAPAGRSGAGAGAGGAGAGGKYRGSAFPADMVAQVKSTNNLVWTRTLAPGAKVDLPFEYSIEHPAGRAVSLYDVKHDAVMDYN